MYVNWVVIMALFLAACAPQSRPPEKEVKSPHAEPIKAEQVNTWELPPVFKKGNFISFKANGAKTSDRDVSGFPFAYKILEVNGKWVHLEQDYSGKDKSQLLVYKDDIKKHLEKPDTDRQRHFFGDASSCRYCQATPWWISDVGWWNTDYMLNVILVEETANLTE